MLSQHIRKQPIIALYFESETGTQSAYKSVPLSAGGPKAFICQLGGYIISRMHHCILICTYD